VSRFTICTAEQRSEAWYLARLGRATGSKAACVTAKPKSGNGEAVTRRDYRVQLAVEQITGVYQEDEFLSADMRRGIELEPAAIAAYESYRGEIARRTGFLSMTDCFVGCSLDFDINDLEGFAEIKCPKAAIHLEYIEENRVPPSYEKQILHNMYVSGAKYCDFVSYNSTFPDHLQLFVIRAERDEVAIKQYETELKRFLAEVSLTVKKIRSMKVAA
jgi:YqaJ-like viral recombinase domain